MDTYVKITLIVKPFDASLLLMSLIHLLVKLLGQVLKYCRAVV